MPTPAIHTMGGALAYLLAGDLSLNRVYMVAGVVFLSNVHDLDFLIPGPHRGFSHSLLFCLIVALLVGYLTKFSFLGAFMVLSSHLLLDSFANGFGTVSWLWPYYKAPIANEYGWGNIKDMIKHSLRIF